ncbi:MAG: MATE family efflux transporter [Lachnospiraceae bacterium]|nr:MATE family efflux transporter [Lachnospiraceae bacterium]
MEDNRSFRNSLIKIAVPVTLQSLLQSSFSVVDQVMTGQLGSTNIAGIGLGGKFSSIFNVVISAVAAVAGIMIAQYIGKEDDKEVGKSFYVNLSLAAFIAVLFTFVSALFPSQIMSMYTKDEETKAVAAMYLRIISISYIPIIVDMLLSTLLRCKEAAVLPLVSSILSACMNTGFNYLLIFGKFGFPEMGAEGAAIATVASRVFGSLLVLLLFLGKSKKKAWRLPFSLRMDRQGKMQYAVILLPILLCEFLWSLGENVYASIYGHIGTEDFAAMSLTIPIQVLMMGVLSGLSQAAAIIVGKALGKGEYERAYEEGKKLMYYGLFGAVILSVLIVLSGRYYVRIYQVEEIVKKTAYQLLAAFALIAPVKVENMILGGGIIRSGGKTKYVMVIDMIGTWIFGVPLGLFAAFVCKFPIPYVYFILSLEEGVRLAISLVVFKKKKWMESLQASGKNTDEPLSCP